MKWSNKIGHNKHTVHICFDCVKLIYQSFRMHVWNICLAWGGWEASPHPQTLTTGVCVRTHTLFLILTDDLSAGGE